VGREVFGREDFTPGSRPPASDFFFA